MKTQKTIAVFGMALVLMTASTTRAEDPVVFADQNLKAAVEEALGIADPTPTDMLSLTYLEANGRGITQLGGIEYATNLEDARLQTNRIMDISPLAGLTNLTGLELRDNLHIADISALSGLAKLESLSMGWNQIAWDRPVPMLRGLQPGAYVYFAHSYYVVPAEDSVVATTTEYGVRFTSAVWKDNVFATQFHPEKSQSVGLRLLRNFVET